MLKPTFSDIQMAAIEACMANTLGDGPIADLGRLHLAQGGSRTRAKLAVDCAKQLHLSRHHGVAIAAAVELLHNASLVHDDLQDMGETRRGHPALWVQHGSDAAICVGDLMISAAFASLAGVRQDVAPALRIAHDAIATTIAGQSRDLSAGAFTQLDTYESIASAKSGPLLALPARLTLHVARQESDDVARDLGAQLALAYQIGDDLNDRAEDADRGALNVCILLEATGLSRAGARRHAFEQGTAALTKARALADALPAQAGVPYHMVADKVGAQLKGSYYAS